MHCLVSFQLSSVDITHGFFSLFQHFQCIMVVFVVVVVFKIIL